MAIFNSYVKLPEGNSMILKSGWWMLVAGGTKLAASRPGKSLAAMPWLELPRRTGGWPKSPPGSRPKANFRTSKPGSMRVAGPRMSSSIPEEDTLILHALKLCLDTLSGMVAFRSWKSGTLIRSRYLASTRIL